MFGIRKEQTISTGSGNAHREIQLHSPLPIAKLRRSYAHKSSIPAPTVTFSMAALAESNQIAHDVSTQFAPWFQMVDLQVFH
jgi:hypothetical protein